MEIEQAIVSKIQRKAPPNKKELRLFLFCFTVFLVGEILLVISTLNYLTIINGVSVVFKIFSSLTFYTYILFFISAFFSRRTNSSFRYSFISICTFIIVNVLYQFAITSNSPLYYSVGQGLKWSAAIVQCIFFLYFFHGCVLLCDKYEFLKGRRHFLIATFIFTGVFITQKAFEYLSGMAVIRRTSYQRIFLYTNWVLQFAMYVSTFVMVLVGYKMLSNFIKKEAEEDEQN